MSTTTHARSAALAGVCRLVTAARRHGQRSVELSELELALDGVDVEGLARPRPITRVCNVGGSRDAAPFNSPG